MSDGAYSSGDFARRAGVTVRTLRYYDRIGLLSPTDRTASGYRVYTDADLEEIERILALKYLGFTLEEIRRLGERDADSLADRLTKQKAMLRDERAKIDGILHAIERAEDALRSGAPGACAIENVIEVMQMEQKDDWVRKYFTPEQRTAMDRLTAESYSDDAREALAGRTWTEEDQKRVDARYAALAAELRRLVAEGADPGSDAAQAAAETQAALLEEFTRGLPQVEEGLQTWWAKFAELPPDQKPPALPWGEEEAAFLAEAMEIYRRRAG